jgi:hypothetical protein
LPLLQLSDENGGRGSHVYLVVITLIIRRVTLANTRIVHSAKPADRLSVTLFSQYKKYILTSFIYLSIYIFLFLLTKRDLASAHFP